MPTQRETQSFTDQILDKQFTRRQLIIGAAGAGAVILAGSGIYYAVESTKDNSGTETLTVPASQVLSIDDCEEVGDLSAFMTLDREIIMPYATLAWAGEDNIAAALVPTEEGSPLVTAETINITDSAEGQVLSGAITNGMRYEIFDFRANEKGYVWTESNIMAGKTYVYTAAAGTSNDGALAMEIDSNWDLPELAACGDYAWIQRRPSDTNETDDKAQLYKIRFGANQDSAELVEETRRFACGPVATKEGLIATPRNTVSSSCYDIKLIDPNSGSLKDVCTLPSSMRPQDVGYGKTGFTFTFSGSYDYGEGISGMGSYASITSGANLAGESGAARDARVSNLGNQNWLHFDRTPFCAPCWLGDMLVFKSTRSIAIFKPNEKQYVLLSADDGADDYGVWLCTSGDCDSLVTLQNIDYTPLSGDSVKECRIRIYKAS